MKKIVVVMAALVLSACGHRPYQPSELDMAKGQYMACMQSGGDCRREKEMLQVAISLEELGAKKMRAGAAAYAANVMGQYNARANYSYWSCPHGIGQC